MASAVRAESRCAPRAESVAALEARLVGLVRGGAPLRRALARLAGRLLATRAWASPGFARPADYARERPGLSARELQDLAHVDAALAKLPAIDGALTSGPLGWTKARLLCRAATPKDEVHWLAAVERLSAAALAREVRACDVGALEAGAFDPALLPALMPALPTGVQIGAPPMGDEPSTVWVANVPADVGRLFRACLCSVQRRLHARPAAALEAMFAHCLATWRWRAPREYRVFERDGWRCTVPGCTSYRSLHAHHVVFRSVGGGDEDANLTTLCAMHHQRGVHAGVIQISGRAPDALVFELPLGRFASGDRVIDPRRSWPSRIPTWPAASMA